MNSYPGNYAGMLTTCSQFRRARVSKGPVRTVRIKVAGIRQGQCRDNVFRQWELRHEPRRPAGGRSEPVSSTHTAAGTRGGHRLGLHIVYSISPTELRCGGLPVHLDLPARLAAPRSDLCAGGPLIEKGGRVVCRHSGGARTLRAANRNQNQTDAAGFRVRLTIGAGRSARTVGLARNDVKWC